MLVHMPPGQPPIGAEEFSAKSATDEVPRAPGEPIASFDEDRILLPGFIGFLHPPLLSIEFRRG